MLSITSTASFFFALLLFSTAATTHAQQEEAPLIKTCNPTTSASCAATSRTCYNYTTTFTHVCKSCLNGYIEYNSTCYNITELQQETQFFDILSEMIEAFTPDFVASRNITREERVNRLVESAKVISYWQSLVPPVLFRLGLNDESTLTSEERKMRLGVRSDIRFDLEGGDGLGKRGRLERFIVAGINDREIDDIDIEDVVGGEDGVSSNPSRRLTATKKGKKQAHRRMQDNPPAVDWHESGYTTIVKNQGFCGCCWAVSTTAAIESALMITNKTNRVDAKTTNNLSFQQMISCDEKNLACEGGNIVSSCIVCLVDFC
jgi:hypothetical protein